MIQRARSTFVADWPAVRYARSAPIFRPVATRLRERIVVTAPRQTVVLFIRKTASN